MGEAAKEEKKAPESSKDNVTQLVTPLNMRNLRQYDHELQQWLVYADPALTSKDLEKPEYWATVASLFRVPAEITIYAEDGSWKRWATVHHADKNFAKVTIDFEKMYNPTQPMAEDPDFSVEWGGPSHKFRVVRKSDNQVLSKEHVTREAAEQWMREHSQAMNR